MMASPMLNRFYPKVLILQEAKWTPGPVWIWSEEKSAPPPPLGIEPGAAQPIVKDLAT